MANFCCTFFVLKNYLTFKMQRLGIQSYRRRIKKRCVEKESKCPGRQSDSYAKEYFNLRGCVTSPPLKSFIQFGMLLNQDVTILLHYQRKKRFKDIRISMLYLLKDDKENIRFIAEFSENSEGKIVHILLHWKWLKSTGVIVLSKER